MPDAAQNKLLSLLTIARKAGKLLLGFDAVCEGAAAGTVCCILLAQDCAARTEKEIRFKCRNAPVRKLGLSMETMQMYFRRRTAVLGVCGAGFAEKCLSLLPAEPEDRAALLTQEPDPSLSTDPDAEGGQCPHMHAKEV